MAARRALLTEASPYFAQMSEKDLPFVSSGCGLLDCILGGGYVLGRVVNLVGDRSSGKTLLAIESTVNFKKKYPKGRTRYAEAESAFDQDYAEALGMPVDSIEFPEDISTVEDFFNDLDGFIKSLNGEAGLYIIDSLDSLSDVAEMAKHEKAMKNLSKAKAKAARDDDDEDGPKEAGSYGTAKAKMMSQGFRRIVRELEQSQCLLIVISQIRDNIGVMFGAKHTRSGGKALDFYASQIVWLSEVRKLRRTVQGVERVTGLDIKAQVKKNKVGLPWRDAEFPILFGYGVDDITASVTWLLKVKETAVLDELRLSATGHAEALRKIRDRGDRVEIANMRKKLDEAVAKKWASIEVQFLPKAGKYA